MVLITQGLHISLTSLGLIGYWQTIIILELQETSDTTYLEVPRLDSSLELSQKLFGFVYICNQQSFTGSTSRNLVQWIWSEAWEPTFLKTPHIFRDHWPNPPLYYYYYFFRRENRNREMGNISKYTVSSRHRWNLRSWEEDTDESQIKVLLPYLLCLGSY